jgi:hypothetical protein
MLRKKDNTDGLLVDMGIFSFLYLLDGVSAIENGPEKGVLN